MALTNKFRNFKNSNDSYTIIWGIETSSYIVIDVKKSKEMADSLCQTLNDIVRESQKLSTSESALPISDVGGSLLPDEEKPPKPINIKKAFEITNPPSRKKL